MENPTEIPGPNKDLQQIEPSPKRPTSPRVIRGGGIKRRRSSGLSREGRPVSHPSRLPVTGAWLEGDHPGQRKFATRSKERPFALEGGGVLPGITVAYETWGTLNDDRSNAVLICHALTGDSHVSGKSSRGHVAEGWWADLVGPGRAVDTDKWFVVCANVLGGCQGTTGPSSIDPTTGTRFGSRFPVVTIRDIVRSQMEVAQSIGISEWASVIGGSMGGMQSLEWAIMYPEWVRTMASIASTEAAGAQQIAWSHVGRMAIAQDPRWRNGDYYDAPDGQGPHEGLSLARSIAQIHYRTEEIYEARFKRRTVEPLDRFDLWDRFQVESYLDYHGEKLVRRFDANSYLVLNKAMDLHDVGRGRGGVNRALERISAPTLTIAVDSDGLYPPYQQERLAQGLDSHGVLFEHVEIHSAHGHDGFLVEPAQVGPPIERLLEEASRRGNR